MTGKVLWQLTGERCCENCAHRYIELYQRHSWFYCRMVRHSPFRQAHFRILPYTFNSFFLSQRSSFPCFVTRKGILGPLFCIPCVSGRVTACPPCASCLPFVSFPVHCAILPLYRMPRSVPCFKCLALSTHVFVILLFLSLSLINFNCSTFIICFTPYNLLSTNC